MFDHYVPDRKKVHPLAKERMVSGESPDWTICAVLRDIYQITNNPEIKLLSRIAATMAKKMDLKLREYKNGNPN